MKAHIVSLSVVSVFLLASCQKNCGSWYEGEACDTELREKLYGTYTGTYTTVLNGDTTANTGVQSIVAQSPEGLQFVTETTHNLQLELRDAERFVLGNQPIILNGTTYEISKGDGNFNGNTLSYSLELGNDGKITFLGSR